jgi:hypothetical protein
LGGGNTRVGQYTSKYGIHKKADKTDCRNYHGTSLLTTSFKILSNILLSRKIPDADEITGITNVEFYVIGQQLTFYIHQIQEKMWKCNSAVQQLG